METWKASTSHMITVSHRGSRVDRSSPSSHVSNMGARSIPTHTYGRVRGEYEVGIGYTQH